MQNDFCHIANQCSKQTSFLTMKSYFFDQRLVCLFFYDTKIFHKEETHILFPEI